MRPPALLDGPDSSHVIAHLDSDPPSISIETPHAEDNLLLLVTGQSLHPVIKVTTEARPAVRGRAEQVKTTLHAAIQNIIS